MSGASRFGHIKVGEIRAGEVALRGVDQDNQSFIELVDSIRSEGILNPISVREKLDEATKEPYYELIDGLQRWTASKLAGLDTIPVHILDKNDEEVMIAQIIGNAKRVEMKYGDYADHIAKILVAKPTMTMGELSHMLSSSESWLTSILKLRTLHPDIKSLVNDGHIKLSNAFALAKLPPEEQLPYLNDAQTKTADEFTGPILERVKQIRTAARSGKAPGAAEFVPVARMRKLSEVTTEIEKQVAGVEAVKAYASTVEDSGISDLKSAAVGFQLGVRWAAKLDQDSVEKDKAQFEATRAANEAEKLRRAQERADKKLAEAQERSAKVGTTVPPVATK